LAPNPPSVCWDADSDSSGLVADSDAIGDWVKFLTGLIADSVNVPKMEVEKANCYQSQQSRIEKERTK
jgi:hypothetical protein